MDNKKLSFINFERLKIYYIYILLFINISLSNCLIEIPLKPIEVKGFSKYKNIQIKEPFLFSNKTKLKNRFLIEEGKGYISNEFLFIINVKIGSNKQEFNLILDTGSYYTWVAKEGSKDAQTISHHFNPSSSNTCVKTIFSTEINYGTGSCNGDFYTDNLYYINDKEFKMTFLVASNTNFHSADGIIGLGRKYPILDDFSFIDMLNKGGVTNSKLFSLKFSNNESGVNGTLLIGKHDDFSKTNVAYCPLINLDKNEGLWECQISSFAMKNLENEIKIKGNYDFIFDTGSNRFILPFEYFSNIDSSLTKFKCYSKTNEEQNTFFII